MTNYQLAKSIYAGLLGKAIGVRLGAPIEPYQWSFERIHESFYPLGGYIKDSSRFASDDDTNGPIYFVRALFDYGKLTPETISYTWLNYTREKQGMFWWGGVGISTEHTAYENLKQGIFAPDSGSKEMNGSIMANQVGGQIFVDSWGLINLGQVEKAMLMAKTAASVAHDEDGLVGAQFISGLIAEAYQNDDIYKVIDKVVNLLPSSHYKEIVGNVIEFYNQDDSKDFRTAYQFVKNNYGYDRYPGMCHIIPNTCLVLIGLLYSQNDFSKAIEITCLCGWDTDSNAGVVGTIMGVLVGLEKIPIKYREPINDLIYASGMSPTLNYCDLVEFAQMLASQTIQNNTPINLTFPFYGCTQGLEIDNNFRLLKDKVTYKTKDKLSLLIDNLVKEDQVSLYLKTMVYKDDLPDDRYDPVFMPRVYPGQSFEVDLETENAFLDELEVCLFMRTKDKHEHLLTDYQHLRNQNRIKLKAKLPTSKLDIERVGVKIRCQSDAVDGNGLLGRLIIHRFSIYNQASYKICFEQQEEGFLGNVTPFANHRSNTMLNEKSLLIETLNEQGVTYTGYYYAKKSTITGSVALKNGNSFNLAFLIKGLENYYYFKIGEKMSLMRRHHLNDELIRDYGKVKLKKINSFKLEYSQGSATLVLNNQSFSFYGYLNEYGHFGFGGTNCLVEISDLIVEVNEND